MDKLGRLYRVGDKITSKVQKNLNAFQKMECTGLSTSDLQKRASPARTAHFRLGRNRFFHQKPVTDECEKGVSFESSGPTTAFVSHFRKGAP